MKLTSEKQKKVIATGFLTLLITLALYLFAIQPFLAKGKNFRQETGRFNEEIENLKKTKSRLSLDAQKVDQYRQQLEKIEAQMPEGPPDTWTIEKVYQISQRHALTLSSSHVISTPELSAILLPESQYEIYYYFCNLKVELFHLGKFLMDLENSFPTAAVDGLTVLPGMGEAPYIHEAQIKLSFLKKKKG